MWESIAGIMVTAFIVVTFYMFKGLGDEGPQVVDPSTPRADDDEGPPY